jgi:hypothetical protein
MRSPILDLLDELQSDWPFTLDYLFAHRHPQKSPAFHKTVIDAWFSSDPRVLVEIFRGGAKTTRAEEALAVMALFQLTDYALVVGNSYPAACERLAAIRYELENNEKIHAMFGQVKGPRWGENILQLTNGVILQAFGAGQSVRGTKSPTTNARPDLALVDDFEDRESVSTPEARRKVAQWFTRELIPALSPDARVRVNGTPLHVDSVIEQFKQSSEWKTYSFPLYTMDGETKVPVWPERFPLEWIEKKYESFRADGDLAGFSQEYLLKPMTDAASIFSRNDMQIVDPSTLRVEFAPKILVVDPARTTNQRTSARTGYAVGAWVGSHLHIYEAFGAFHTPFEQVATIFDLARTHAPMTVAVEEDGLNQWLLQPIRAEMVRRGDILPLQPVKAPQNKDGFIRGLQPFFQAREVRFMKELPDLVEELMTFPMGRKDVVNAVAYLLRLRPGMPVYPSFSSDHILHKAPHARADWFLFVNATAGVLQAVLVFVQDGATHVARDWVLEGSLDESLRAVLISVAHEMPQNKRAQMVLPFERTLANDMSGLSATIKRMQIQFRTGKRVNDALECLDAPLRTRRGIAPLLTVSPEATWTLNALAGGYCRDPGTTTFGVRDNIHKYVAQALEAGYASISGYALDDDTSQDVVWARSDTGRRYISMRR